MHRVPKLRIHTAKRLAYVCLAGRQVHLARHTPPKLTPAMPRSWPTVEPACVTRCALVRPTGPCS
jgi:hypothetical protein